MPQGLQVWDASGGLVLDLQDRITRVIGVMTLGPTASGHITNAAFATGTIWWVVFVAGTASPSYAPIITPDPANNRIQYAPRGWPESVPTSTIVYGVY